MKNNNTLKNLRIVWKYAKKNKKLLAIYIAGYILLTIGGAITPVLTAQALLKVTNNLLNQLIALALIILGIEIIKSLARYISNNCSQVLFSNVLLEVQRDISKEILKFKTSVLDNNHSGAFIDRMTKDTNDISSGFNDIFVSLTNIVTNVGILIAVLIVNKYVFLFFMVAILVLFWFRKIRIQSWFKAQKEYLLLNENNTSLIAEIIRGLRDIKVLNASKNIVKIESKQLAESNQKRCDASKSYNKYRLFSEFIQSFIDLSFILLAVFLVNKDMLSITSFVVLYLYRGKIYNLLDYISRISEQSKKFDISAGRVFDLLDEELYPKETFGNKHLDKVNGDFEFKNVNFGYKEDRNIIKDLSFKIKANTTTAFVGKSGSGKSTIFSLLTKLYNIKDGEILIDGINIDLLDEESIRGNITVITQSPYIFNFSIKDNLKVVNEKASDEDIIKACKKASLHDFIMTLPDKYETLIGEGGIMLSGGERQRLAIARALLKKSEIILFDEATSSLDNQTQMEIQKAINNIKGTYTILIIAHRLSTVMDSERIIVIDQGQIVGEGTHKELYKDNKLYRELYEKELAENIKDE